MLFLYLFSDLLLSNERTFDFDRAKFSPNNEYRLTLLFFYNTLRKHEESQFQEI